MARETVLSLAEWVIAMDDGTQTPWGVIDPGATGLASSTRSATYHGPGRGAGNSINVLLDAFDLSGQRRYLVKAEELICRCVHPKDDIAARNLDDAEERWSYLVFLQALGRYLDLKLELHEHDRVWAHARASLDAYARWMLDHEVPYLKVLDRVEYATEAWPAQDVRKAVVFGYAARHGGTELRTSFLDAAGRYFCESLSGVAGFPPNGYTRTLAILLQNGWVHLGLRRAERLEVPRSAESYEVGMPIPFEPQLARIRRLARSPRDLLKLAGRMARPDRFGRFVGRAVCELWRRRP
jgi:hypothetical protein